MLWYRGRWMFFMSSEVLRIGWTSELCLKAFPLKRNEKFSKENLNEQVLYFYSALVSEDIFLSGGCKTSVSKD